MRRHIRDIYRTFATENVEVLQANHLGSGHIRFITDIGPIVTPSTPGDHRWPQNFTSHIRRLKR